MTTMNDIKALEQQVQDLRAQIQKSEKLSSLGILSAGIAHEIQNPLNFVINFSQMSNDMVDDLTDILDEKGIDLEDEANDELKETIADDQQAVDSLNQGLDDDDMDDDDLDDEL